MANLADVERPIRSVRQRTANRDSIIPLRRNTDAPALEVNARIQRPQGSAEELRRILNLADDTAEAFIELAGVRKARKDLEEGGQAALDHALGVKDETRFEDSKAYRLAYQREGVISLGTETDRVLTDAINTRLADEDDPATLEDIDEIIDAGLRKVAVDPTTGKPLDFGSPQATAHLARAFLETRMRLRTEAAKAIKERADAKLVDTVAFNVVDEISGQAPGFRQDHLAPIGELEGLPGLAPIRPASSPRASLPTGRPPVPGKVTQTMAQHSARGSVGVDIDGRIGDPVEAPASGRVKKVGRNAKSGTFVILDHGNGVESTYAHLSQASVKAGDFVPSGVKFAAVGNSGSVSKRTGDGSHLHWRVKVNGKDVDPLSFRFASGAEGASEPDAVLSSETAHAASSVAESPPRIDFEEALERATGEAGNRIPRDFAKKRLIQVLVVAANERKDPSILDGLWLSKRADGSPSFSPDEMLYLQNSRDALRNQVRVEAERSENERFEKNHDEVLEAFVKGQEPTIAQIRQLEAAGDIRPGFALSLINTIEAEEKARLREQRADAREAQAKADSDIDFLMAVEADALRAGAIAGVSAQSLQRRFERGEFGQGRRAVGRYKSLVNALRQGGEIAERSPESAVYAKRMEALYGPRRGGNGSLVMDAMGPAGGRDPVSYAAMVAHYSQLVRNGTSPAEAYQSAVQKYAPKPAPAGAAESARRARIAELERKAAGR
ncbi:M23 family metallopeptidase [Allosphingosinicella humi]